MRIQNNIMALNTHRQYTIQNDKVSSSAEKLSSGYRINRAADDAAGLAISEKMRSQIRGLNMAARNSQDAASLIQTAEGALQEVHSMLQRMNELADQSATGTNAEFDRTQIAKEFNQLKREINDIAEQTTFNNMKILDGSLSVQGFQRSAATVGLYASSLGDMASVNAVNKTTPTQPNIGALAEKATSAAFSDVAQAGDTAGGKQYRVSLTFTDANGGTRTVEGGIVASTTDGTDGEISKEQISAAFANVTFQAADGTKYKLTDNTDGTLTAEGLTKSAAIDLASATVSFAKLDDANPAVADQTVALTNNVQGSAGKRESTIDLDISKLNVGDTLTVGDKTYELVNTLAEAKDGNIGIEWKTDAQRSTANLVAGLNSPTPSGVVVAAGTGDQITITQSAADSDASISFSHKSNATQGTQVEFDLAKLKDGDELTINVSGDAYKATFRAGDSVEDIFNNMGIQAAGTTDKVYVKDNSIVVKEQIATAEFTGVTASDNDYGTMRIQVGALEGEQLNIEVKAMNTAGLGLDAFKIDTQDEAGKAITAVRSAIDIVSDQRALLGAMQNRMTYKINNIKISAENLQAAESRIRDVDIASEMTQFTKANILGQAATAMLAQANSAPQNVLSLLR